MEVFKRYKWRWQFACYCIYVTYRKWNLHCRFFSFFFCFFSVFFCLIIFLLFMAASDKSSCCANFFALICVSSGNNLSTRNIKDKGFLQILKLIMKIPNIHFRIQFFYFPFQRQHQQRHQRQLRQLLNLYSYQYVRRWLPRVWGSRRRASTHPWFWITFSFNIWHFIFS